MKHILTMALTLLMAVTMHSQVTFTAADWAQAQSLSDGATVTSYTSGNVTVTFAQGTSSNAVVWNATSSYISTATGNTMTISVGDGYELKQVKFTMNGTTQASNLAAATWSVGSASASGADVNWQGSAQSVSVTITAVERFKEFSFTVKELEEPIVEDDSSYNDTTIVSFPAWMDNEGYSDYENFSSTITYSAAGKTVVAVPNWTGRFESGKLFLNDRSSITFRASYAMRKIRLSFFNEMYLNRFLYQQQGTVYTPATCSTGSFSLDPTDPSGLTVRWLGNANEVTMNLGDAELFTSWMIISDNTDNNATVTFYGLKGELLKSEEVPFGGNATAPVVTHECFGGWDKDFSIIHSNLDVYAVSTISATITCQEWHEAQRDSLSYSKDGYTITASYANQTSPLWEWDNLRLTQGDGFTISREAAFKEVRIVCDNAGNAARLASSTCNTGRMVQKADTVYWYGETNALTVTHPASASDNIDIRSFLFACDYYEQVPCTVIFVNEAGQEVAREVVLTGDAVTNIPAGPAASDECLEFAHWDADLSRVMSDLTVRPVFDTVRVFTLTASEWNTRTQLGPISVGDFTLSQQNISYSEGRSSLFLNRRNTKLTVVNRNHLYNLLFTCDSESDANTLASCTCTNGSLVANGTEVRWKGDTDSLVIYSDSRIYIRSIATLCHHLNPYTVVFLDENDQPISTQQVLPGDDALAPADPVHSNECMQFMGWDKEFTNVHSDLTIRSTWQLEEDCVPAGHVKVVFTDIYNEVIDMQFVLIGGDATAPQTPVLSCHTFIGWDHPLTNITESVTIKPTYTFDINSPDIMTVSQWCAFKNSDEFMDKTTFERYYAVKGVIYEMLCSTVETGGTLSFRLTDNGESDDCNVNVYHMLSVDYEPFYSAMQLSQGDTVIVYGTYVEGRWVPGYNSYEETGITDGYTPYIGRVNADDDIIYVPLPRAEALYDFSGNGLKQMVMIEHSNGGAYYNYEMQKTVFDCKTSYILTKDITKQFLIQEALATFTYTASESLGSSIAYFEHLNADNKPEISTFDKELMMSNAGSYAFPQKNALAVTNMDINCDGRKDYMILDQSRTMSNRVTAEYGAIAYQLADGSFQEERMQVFTWDEFVAQMTPEELDQYQNPQNYSLGEVSRYTYVGTWGGAALARSPRRNAPGVKKAPGLGSMISAPTKMIDLNKDGLMDLIDEKSGVIYTNMDNGKWVWTSTNGAVIPADLNNDGITDFIFPGEKLYTVIYNKNTNQLVQNLLYQNAASDNLVHCYDFDQDGDVDILATFSAENNATGYAYTCFFKNNGNGAFIKQPEQDYGANSLAFKALQDLDGDGYYDLLAYNPAGNHLYNLVWLKGQSGLLFNTTPQVISSFSAGTEWYDAVQVQNTILSAEDLDNDGKLEIWISGRNEGVTEFYPLPDNITVTANTRPSAPAAPTLSYASGSLTVTWGNGSDDKTAVADLTYALRIGTTPGGNEILAAHANADGTRRNFLDGNMGKEHAYTIDLTSYTPATIYVAVQAIDAQHAGSVWSQEATVVHDLVPVDFTLDRNTINLNETAVLTFTALPEGYTHAWTVQDGSYVQSPESATKLILSFTSGGEKTVTHTVTTPNGGTLTASATIQVMPAGVGEPILFVDQWGGSDLPVNFSSPMADYNFDGRLDGIKGSNSSVMTVMEGTNTDQMYNQAPGLWNTNIPAGSIKWYDYNRDGALDFITSSSSDYGVLYHDATLPTLTARQTDNNLLYFFDFHQSEQGTSYEGKPFGRDMTHNGLYDMWMGVWANSSNHYELIEVDGTDEPDWKQFAVNGDAEVFKSLFRDNGRYLLYADFDHDGFTDIAAYPRHDDGTYDSKLNVFYNRGNAHFEQHDMPFPQSLTFSEWGYAMALEDLNGDSYLDLIVRNIPDNDGQQFLTVLWNNANQSFSAPLALPNTDKLSYSNSKVGVLTDLDNNGYTDIIASVENPIYGEEHRGVYVWYMGAEGLLTHGFLLPDVQYSYDISMVNIAAGDRRLLVSDALYPIVAQADARPAAPTNIQASMTNDGLLITWDAAVDDHTPATLMRYNLAVKQQGATTYLISPQNGLNANAAFLPDYDYIEGTSYLIPTSYLNNGNYEITIQALDRQDQLSFFSETAIVPVTRNPIEVPSFVCADEDVTVSYRGSETTGTPVWNFGGAVKKSGSGFGPYTVYWLSGGEKTVTLTLNGQTYTQTVTVDNLKSIEVSIPTVLYEETPASASVPEGIEYQWFASIASIDDGALYPINQYGIVLPTTTVFANYDKRLTAQGLNVTAHYVRNATDKTLEGEEVKLYLKVTNANYCEHYFYSDVTVLASTNIPTLTLVTTDANGHNVINWTNADAFASVNVYKEGNSLNDFQLIGSAAASAGTYTDNTSDASQKAERYRLTGVTANGNESPESAIHKTVHLTINRGVQSGTYNLIWNEYAGASVTSYIILRGASPTSLTSIATVAASNTSYTDQAPDDNLPYYAIEYILSTASNAPATNTNRAPAANLSGRSNVVDRRSAEQGLENVQRAQVPCTKVLIDGEIFILREDKIYTLTGQEVK